MSSQEMFIAAARTKAPNKMIKSDKKDDVR